MKLLITGVKVEEEMSRIKISKDFNLNIIPELMRNFILFTSQITMLYSNF